MCRVRQVLSSKIRPRYFMLLVVCIQVFSTYNFRLRWQRFSLQVLLVKNFIPFCLYQACKLVTVSWKISWPVESTEQDSNIAKLSANNEHFSGDFSSFTISLITRLNMVALETAPWGTLFVSSCVSEESWPIRTEKKRWIRKISIKIGRQLRKPKSCNVCNILWRQVKAYDFEQSKKTARRWWLVWKLLFMRCFGGREVGQEWICQLENHIVDFEFGFAF